MTFKNIDIENLETKSSSIQVLNPEIFNAKLNSFIGNLNKDNTAILVSDGTDFIDDTHHSLWDLIPAASVPVVKENEAVVGSQTSIRIQEFSEFLNRLNAFNKAIKEEDIAIISNHELLQSNKVPSSVPSNFKFR